jgi:hypothetical protein
MLNDGYFESSSMPLWRELQDAARLVQCTKRNESRKTNRDERRRKAEENLPNVAFLPDIEDDPMAEY